MIKTFKISIFISYSHFLFHAIIRTFYRVLKGIVNFNQ